MPRGFRGSLAVVQDTSPVRTLESVSLPDRDEWARLARQLERRAQALRDPAAIARQQFQRAEILQLELGDPAGARAAYEAALDAWPGHLPAFLALRDLAIQLDDERLGESLFERALTHYARPGVDARDAGEIFGTFALLWLFRWRHPDRAEAALAAAGAGLGVARELEPLLLDRVRHVGRLRERLERADTPERRAGIAADLGRLLLDELDQPEPGKRFLEEAALHEPSARWRLAEAAARAGRAPDLARHLELLSEALTGPLSTALRFLAAEQYEFVLNAPARAAALYEEARGGSLLAVVGLKRVLAAVVDPATAPGALAARLVDEADRLAELGLDRALGTRAVELFATAGEVAAAEAAARQLLERHPDAHGAREALVRLLWRDRRWPELSAALREPAPIDRGRRLAIAAVQEHGLHDVEGARQALGDPGALARGGGAEGLLVLRTLQRLYARTRPTDVVRAWQYEADTHDGTERRAHLYLRIGRHFLKHTVEQEKGLTYLFWVLDHDPENLTALRLIEFVSRARNSHRPLMEILARELPLLDRPLERFPLERELARLLEGPGGDPQRAVELYEAALADQPGDPDTVADLARMYQQLGRPQDLAALLDGLLRRPVTAAERVRLLVRLGELYEGEKVREPRRARRRYAEALNVVREAREPLSGDIATWIARAEAGLDRLGGPPPATERAFTAPPAPLEEDGPTMVVDTSAFDEGAARLRAGPGSFEALIGVLAGQDDDEAPSPRLEMERTPPGRVERGRLPPLPRPPTGETAPPAVMRGASVRGEGRRTMQGGWSRGEPAPRQPRSAQAAEDAEDEEPAPSSPPDRAPSAPLPGVSPAGSVAPTSRHAVSPDRNAPTRSRDADARSPAPAARDRIDADAPALAADGGEESVPFAPWTDDDEPTLQTEPGPATPDEEIDVVFDEEPTPAAPGFPPPVAPAHDAPGFPAAAPAGDVLGAERQRARDEDPARAVVARKLRRARAGSDWPDLGDDAVAAAVRDLEQAADESSRAEAAAALAERYEAAGALEQAAAAWRAVLSWHAGEARAVARLADLCRRLGDWRGLADVLAREAEATGDRDRRRALLLEVAGLHFGPLGDPGASVPFYREALKSGPPSPDVLAALAAALRTAGRWEDYAALLTIGTLGEALDAERALELGRVYLRRLGAPEKAATFVRRAAEAFPDRVDISIDLAAVEAALGDLDAAVARIEGAIERAPAEDVPALRVRLARLLEDRGAEPDRVRAAYRVAVQAGLDDPAVLERVEHLAVDARDWETVAEVLERRLAVLREVDDPEARRELAVRLGHLYYKRLDQPARAAACFVEAFELRPDDGSLYRVVEGLLARNPAPALQIRLYEAHLRHGEPRDPVAVGLRLAAAYEADGRVDDAARQLVALHQRAPNDVEVVAGMERVFRRAERWAELVALYQAQLAAAPDDQQIALLRRLAHALEVGLRDLPGATEVYARIHALDPADAGALRAQTRLLEAQKRWQELLALSAEELGTTQDRRQRAHIHFRMGGLRETQLRDHAGARTEYRRALELDPRCFPALHGLRELATAAGDWPEVVRWLEQEARLWDEPRERAAVLARIAEVYDQRLGDRETAVAFFRRAVATSPACLPAARFLAEDAFGRGAWADAAPFFQIITHQNLEKWPRAERADVFYKRGVVALHLGRLIEAGECLKIALEVNPGHTEALHALVRAWAGERRDAAFDELMKRLDEQYERAGEPAEKARIDILRGYAAERALDLPGAARFYERAAALVPGDLDALRPLVDLHLAARRWDAATAALRAFADRQPGTPTALAALTLEAGVHADYAVDPGRALTCWRQVLALDPWGRDARFRMAQCHYLQADYERARTVMLDLLGMAGDAPAAEQALYRFYLGRIEQTGFQRPAEALAHYASALEADPRCAPAMLALLRLLSERGDEVQVDALLRRHLEFVRGADGADPAAAALKTFAARLLLTRGDDEGARRLLGDLTDRPGPGRRDARFALARMHRQRGEPDAAAAQLYRLLDDNVCDLTALRSLLELFDAHGDEERAYHALSVLELFGALTPDEQARHAKLEERARRALERAGRALPEELIEEHLVHPSFHSPVVPLLRLCDAELARRFPLRPRPDPRLLEAVDGRKHPFWNELKALQGLLGFRAVDLYLAPDEPAALALWPGEPALLVIGGEAATEAWTTAERRFLVARALGCARTGLARLHDLEPERALDLLTLLEGLFAPRPEGDDEPDAFFDALPKKVAEAVRGVIEAAFQGTLPALYTGESVLVGLTHTFDRVGLLAGGVLRPAVESLARLESGVGAAFSGGADLGWAVRSRSRLQDVVKFALSEPYHRLRRAAGLAI